MNVLVLAPHPDDECIGCGGAIRLHVTRGDTVSAVFLTSGELGLKNLPREQAWAIREAEAKAAAKVLGLCELVFFRCSDWTLADDLTKASDLLRPILTRIKPDLIYLPHTQDWHPDHQATLPILREAMSEGSEAALRAYEVWTPLSQYDYVEDITPVMSQKLEALRAHKSQLQDFDYARAITGLNEYRGVLAGRCDYAEVFQSVKL